MRKVKLLWVIILLSVGLCMLLTLNNKDVVTSTRVKPTPQRGQHVRVIPRITEEQENLTLGGLALAFVALVVVIIAGVWIDFKPAEEEVSDG